jgi:hypothetical protein
MKGMKETKETLDTLDTLATLDTMDTPKGTKNQYVIFQPSSPQGGLTREHMVSRRDHTLRVSIYQVLETLSWSFLHQPFRCAKC